jgi:soluble lytic murein transglycosylase-like protein
MARKKLEAAELAVELDTSGHVQFEQPGVSVSSETVQQIIGALPTRPAFSVRAWAFGIVVQAFLFVGLVAGAYLLRDQIRTLRRETEAQRESTQTWLAQSAAMTQETQTLEKETRDLRQYLASSTAEDLLLLKILVIKPSIDQGLAQKIAHFVHHYSELHGRDPNLVLAIITVESDFNPKALSPVGATGLMQVMPQWKKVLGITEDLTDVETSIRYGLQVLGFYMEMYRDLETALTAYNRGPGPVDNALMHGKDPKNQYPVRVLAAYEKLKRLTVRTGSR